MQHIIRGCDMSQAIESIKLVQNEDGSWRSWDAANDDCMDNAKVIDVIPAVKDGFGDPLVAMGIEQRVSLSLAVGRYLRSADRFNEASKEFTGACKALRKNLGTSQRLVVQIDFKHYLVTSDRHGNFDVDPVASV